MKILEVIRSALRSPDASSADIRAALAAIDLPPLEAAVVAAERNRTGLLLDGTEAALDKADDVLKIAIRDRDRAIAAQAELSKRLTMTEEAEARSALDAERDAIDWEANVVEKLLRDRWIKLQTETVTLLDRLYHAERKIKEVNDRLGTAGRTDMIKPIEARVFPTPKFELHEMHSILNRTVLKPIDGVPGWRDEAPGFPMHFGPQVGNDRRGNVTGVVAAPAVVGNFVSLS